MSGVSSAATATTTKPPLETTPVSVMTRTPDGKETMGEESGANEPSGGGFLESAQLNKSLSLTIPQTSSCSASTSQTLSPLEGSNTDCPELSYTPTTTTPSSTAHNSLTTTIPTPASASSQSPFLSTTSLPSVLQEDPNGSTSIHTVRTSLSVKFAPLPELAPRKRKSSVPLGMAARSQLVRRRRNYAYADPDMSPHYNVVNPQTGETTATWTEEELAQLRMQQVAAAVRERQRREQAAAEAAYERSLRRRAAADTPAPDPLANDPLADLGRKLSIVSKQLWKKMSKKDLKAKEDAAASEKGALNGTQSTNGILKTASQDNESERDQSSSLEQSRSNSSSSISSTSTSTPTSPFPAPQQKPLRSILIPSTPPAPLELDSSRSSLATESSIYPGPVPIEDEPEEQGGVWEETIDPSFPLHRSQSESTSFEVLSGPSTLTLNQASKRLSQALNLFTEDELLSKQLSELTTDTSEECKTPTPSSTFEKSMGSVPTPSAV